MVTYQRMHCMRFAIATNFQNSSLIHKYHEHILTSNLNNILNTKWLRTLFKGSHYEEPQKIDLEDATGNIIHGINKTKYFQPCLMRKKSKLQISVIFELIT